MYVEGLVPEAYIIQGDVFKGLSLLEDEVIDCCITSPPYYGHVEQLTGAAQDNHRKGEKR